MSSDYDLLCFSHLRWNFVFQRPQHLLTRCARERSVLFIEEPVFGASAPHLEIQRHPDGVDIAVPQLPHGLSAEEVFMWQRQLIDRLMTQRGRKPFVSWYYTPMALPFTRQLQPMLTIYDCMDELANFQGAPPMLQQLERELLSRADLVFTGGHSLYEVKRWQHPRVHPFPSSVDVPHFASARQMPHAEPAAQAEIPYPRLGFFGVIDERMDLALLDAVAAARPEWQLVMLGPVVKIDPATLPQRSNIHWLGGKSYQELPRYIAGWQVALLPFAQNEATRFISPTKTPEYLAAGKPVVSTPIRDVVRPYGELGLAYIAADSTEFISAIERALGDDLPLRQQKADAWLSQLSWDRTWGEMQLLIEERAAQQAEERLRTGRVLFASGPLAAVRDSSPPSIKSAGKPASQPAGDELGAP